MELNNEFNNDDTVDARIGGESTKCVVCGIAQFADRSQISYLCEWMNANNVRNSEWVQAKHITQWPSQASSF